MNARPELAPPEGEMGRLERVPLLGIIGFVVAGLLGIAWAVIALKSGKL